jgi:hypothetical protein
VEQREGASEEQKEDMPLEETAEKQEINLAQIGEEEVFLPPMIKWQTYQNPDLDFQFFYPETWGIIEVKNDEQGRFEELVFFRDGEVNRAVRFYREPADLGGRVCGKVEEIIEKDQQQITCQIKKAGNWEIMLTIANGQGAGGSYREARIELKGENYYLTVLDSERLDDFGDVVNSMRNLQSEPDGGKEVEQEALMMVERGYGKEEEPEN